MGREVKRVPLDFEWPTDKTWSGYLMPDSLHETDCTDCAGRGETPARLWVAATAAMLLMLDTDRQDQERGRAMHPYFDSYRTDAYGTRPSPDIAEFGEGLAGRAASFMGHDSIDNWVATKKVIEAAGLDPEVWGICQTCEGHGSTEDYPGQRAEADAWERSEPPTGDGWQMWETTSEGSPMSPVHDTPEALADWLAETGASVFGGKTTTRERWLSIIRNESMAAVQIAPGVIAI